MKVKVKINPILINMAEAFKKSHSSEPDSVAAIALMIALNWRTNKEPYLATISEMAGTMFDMPEKLARKLHPFLVTTQGDLLGQLINNDGFYGGDYEEVLSAANEINADYSLKNPPIKDTQRDWEWHEGYVWPQFTFIDVTIPTPQTINYKKIKLSQ